ncbi:hypothetical protein HWV62_25981 [Athelia sp. TMB]|nr:hypothetical protein HWV62_25981 [Athelia sp. TMB]
MDAPRMPSPFFVSHFGQAGQDLQLLPDALILPPAFDLDSSSEWATDVEDDFIPPMPLPSPPKVGKKRKRKVYPSDAAAKREHRRNKRCRKKDAPGPTALRAPLYTGTPGSIQTELRSEAHFPVNGTGYSADRIESIQPGQLWNLQELKDIGLDVLSWDGISPITILDDEGRVVAVLVGRPVNKSSAADDWPKVVAGLEAAINQLERDLSLSKKQYNHRRAPHPAKAFGVSHGGGQTCPSILKQGSARNERAVRAFRNNKYVKRAAHFGSSAFTYYSPKLYARYCDYFGRLRKHDPFLVWNFPRSIFPATTVNFGPSAVCYDHLDYGNAAAGWCAITSAGTYDPKLGGHLVLFDIDKIVEFPPGSTILIPSSVMWHANTPIQEGETRVGITQYAAGALFRYIDHGFKLQADASEEVRARAQEGAQSSTLTVYPMPPRKKRAAEDELWNHDQIPVAASTLELSRDGKHVRWSTSQVQAAAPVASPEVPAIEVPEYLAEDASLQYGGNFPAQESSEDAPPLENVKLSRKRYVNSSMLTNISDTRAGDHKAPTKSAPAASQPPLHFVAKTALIQSFTVLHTNGIHQLAVDFCNCSPAVELRIQCMRHSWWPASMEKPRSAATFTLLKQFQRLSLQGKLAVYNYYKSQELMTDGSGLEHILMHLSQLSLMVREYRHVKMLARAGRGHDPAGIAATKPGEIAVHCRACPQPGINLPEGWEQDVENVWLYALIIAMDACFRLQNRSRSSDAKDPTLGPSWAMFVDDAPYHEHLKNYIHKDEISSCAGFVAIFLTNLKRTTAVRTTGAGGVLCSRHKLWPPNGLGDLQKGERYANMDYILFCSLRLLHILLIFLSYDIMCQWIVNLWARVLSLPEAIRPTFPKEALVGKIPQFHLEAHGRKCYA